MFNQTYDDFKKTRLLNKQLDKLRTEVRETEENWKGDDESLLEYKKGIVEQMIWCQVHLEKIRNQKLLREARRNHVTIPNRDDKDFWEEHSDYFGDLTDNGKAFLNTELIKIKRERHELALKWVQVLI